MVHAGEAVGLQLREAAVAPGAAILYTAGSSQSCQEHRTNLSSDIVDLNLERTLRGPGRVSPDHPSGARVIGTRTPFRIGTAAWSSSVVHDADHQLAETHKTTVKLYRSAGSSDRACWSEHRKTKSPGMKILVANYAPRHVTEQ